MFATLRAWFWIRTVAPARGGSWPASNCPFPFVSRYTRPDRVAAGSVMSRVIFQSGTPSPSASTSRRIAASSVTTKERVLRGVAPTIVRGSTAPVENVTPTLPNGASTEYRPSASVVASSCGTPSSSATVTCTPGTGVAPPTVTVPFTNAPS